MQYRQPAEQTNTVLSFTYAAQTNTLYFFALPHLSILLQFI